MQTRYVIAMILGGLMIGIGVWILIASLLLQRPPITRSLGLDLGFAVFFILRGAMNLHRVRTASRRAVAMPNGDGTQG